MFKSGLKKEEKLSRPQAQTIIELAVFGAILIFILGVIIRGGYQYSLNQNLNLKAMRQAMLLSFRHSWGVPGSRIPSSAPDADRVQSEQGNQSRNQASVVILEDRLSPDSSQYGSADRSPVSINASATHTRNLLNQIDFGDDFDLPRIDFFINGAHFPMTTAAFRRIDLLDSTPYSQLGYATFLNAPPPGQINPWDPWERTCMRVPCTPSECTPGCLNAGWRCDTNNNRNIACPRFYKLIPNHQSNGEWCFRDGTGQGECQSDRGTNDEIDSGWPLERRFDLGRDGSTGAAAANDITSPELRENFAWQWGRVLPYFDEDLENVGEILLQGRNGARPPAESYNKWPVTIRTNLCEEPLRCNNDTMEELPDIEDDLTAQNTSVDVDGDFKSETILAVTYQDAGGALDDIGGIITHLHVIDNQEGDLDYTQNTRDALGAGSQGYEPPGLRNDLQMFTFMRDGTVLRIEEGRLFGPGGQFVRSVQQRDHVDLIQRIFQLSNNTGRFCSRTTGDQIPTRPATVDEIPNSVAVCCNVQGDGGTGGCRDAQGPSGTSCFHDLNIERTCMEVTNRIIYIRSRPADRFGRKWITDVSGDPYVGTSQGLPGQPPGPVLMDPPNL